MEPRTLQPAQLLNYWPDIKYGLEEVLRKTPTATWIPEDIYAAIKYGHAVCVLGMNNEDIEGFFVGVPKTDKTFFVWAVWLDGNLQEGVKHLIDFTKKANCTRIAFDTDRKGWERVARKYGFRPKTWIMEI